jgi:formiminotetrahydrofolate cyclodeaminase
MMSSESVLDESVAEFIDAVASDAPTPGGGAVSGTVAALAAGLAAMAGRYALKRDPDSALFREFVDRADVLRSRAAALADDDAKAYGRYVEATRMPREPDPQDRRAAIRAALDAAADVPFALGGLAAEVAAVGEQLADSGNPNLRSDACAATLLGSAVAASTAILVEENLRGRPGDGRVAEARKHAIDAADAARRVVASYGYLQDRISR